MKKILIFSYIPYPLNGGGQMAQFAVLQVLQYKMDITFCAVLFNKDAEKNIEPLQQLLPNVKIITAFNGSTAKVKKVSLSRRSVNMARKVLNSFNQPKKVSGLFSNDDFRNPKTNNPFDHKSEQFIKQVYDISREHKYDIIQTEFHPFIELVNVFPVNVKTVFVAHESRFLRLKSAFEESTLSNEIKKFLIKRNEIVEVGMMQQYSSIVVFSELDKKELENCGVNNAHAIPFPIMESEFLPNKKCQQPQRVVFIGNEGHVPNKEGLLWYLNNCHEACVKRLKLPLTIIGNWSIKEEVLNKFSNVEFVGSVENIDPYYEEAILIVPIFKGSGIRTKILYGMAKKIPIVSTTFGCSGIEALHEKHLLLADDPESFVSSMENILINQSGTEQMVNHGFDFVNKNYNQQAILEKRLALYNSITAEG